MTRPCWHHHKAHHEVKKKKRVWWLAGWLVTAASWGQKLNKRPSVRKRKDGNVEDNHNATLIATSSRWKWIQISPDSFIIIHKVDSERQQLQGAPVNQRPSHFIIQQTTHTHTHTICGLPQRLQCRSFHILDEIFFFFFFFMKKCGVPISKC
jgi:hypothetical protein